MLTAWAVDQSGVRTDDRAYPFRWVTDVRLEAAEHPRQLVAARPVGFVVHRHDEDRVMLAAVHE